jgi:2-deoxy-D-gluconate 3-dehydrogenase
MAGMFDLTGKVAMVTGGNGGIGLGIAKGLATAGADIVVAAQDKTKTAAAVDAIRELGADAMGLALDVADEDSVAEAMSAALDRFGRVDCLVNNAGIAVRKPPEEYSVEEWDRVMGVNLRGVFLCARAVHPVMAAAGGGKIVNIGSMTSLFGSDWVASYSASKGGVVQLTKSLAIAWAKDGIQVNAILPGWIRTDLTAAIERPENRERHTSISSRIPSGRWGEPGDLAGTAVFLASRASDYVTGTAIPVDGGYSSY